MKPVSKTRQTSLLLMSPPAQNAFSPPLTNIKLTESSLMADYEKTETQRKREGKIGRKEKRERIDSYTKYTCTCTSIIIQYVYTFNIHH